ERGDMGNRTQPSSTPLPPPPVRTGGPKRVAAGVRGVAAGLGAAVGAMGVRRTALTLARVNQPGGFDCPGCAWPEPSPDRRSHAEFCEQGAKAVADEATLRRCGPEFFATHPISDLATRTDHWLGRQGRLVTPMVRRPGADHYTPIGWDEALDLFARELRACTDPDQAVFYTSGRTSNEAAFLWQLLARAYGTNNLPDCSNMCHESSGVAPAPGRSRPAATPPAARPARRPSCGSCSPGRTAPTAGRTAPACATSPPASRWARRSASGRARSRSTTSTPPGSSWWSARTRA